MKNQMLATIAKSTRKNFSKFTRKVHAKKPELCIIGGIGCGVIALGLACYETFTAVDVVEEENKVINDLKELKSGYENGEIKPEADENGEVAVTPESIGRVIAFRYFKLGGSLLKVYAPAIIFEAVSIALVLTGHRTLRRRYTAALTAYTILDEGFKKYRSNVVSRFGEQVDYELKNNILTTTEKEIVVDPETGKVTEVEKKKEISNGLSDPYTFYFDEETSKLFTAGRESAEFMFKAQIAVANDRLEHQGHIYLNEVLDLLCMPRTEAGQIVGWVYDWDRNDVDSLIEAHPRRSTRVLPDGTEIPTIILDFNVDGAIVDEMKNYQYGVE